MSTEQVSLSGLLTFIHRLKKKAVKVNCSIVRKKTVTVYALVPRKTRSPSYTRRLARRQQEREDAEQAIVEQKRAQLQARMIIRAWSEHTRLRNARAFKIANHIDTRTFDRQNKSPFFPTREVNTFGAKEARIRDIRKIQRSFERDESIR